MSIVDDIADLLSQERQALRDGSFDQLSELGARKSSLFARLENSSFDVTDLQQLQRQVDRNRALLEAAQRGFGAALTQIHAAQSSANPQTYGPDGARDALGPKPSRVEKRY